MGFARSGREYADQIPVAHDLDPGQAVRYRSVNAPQASPEARRQHDRAIGHAGEPHVRNVGPVAGDDFLRVHVAGRVARPRPMGCGGRRSIRRYRDDPPQAMDELTVRDPLGSTEYVNLAVRRLELRPSREASGRGEVEEHLPRSTGDRT